MNLIQAHYASTNPLPQAYYLDQDVVSLARDLLGKILHTDFNGHHCAAKIVETEAYRAPEDKASHAYGNRKTARTEVMFGAGGRAYVYLCYGIHHLFNIVTGPEGMAHAVLIRGVEPLDGTEHMLRRRSLKALSPRLTAGPGILSMAMGIQTRHTGQNLWEKGNIWISDQGQKVKKDLILQSPRVGVQYAEECASWPWRFRIIGNSWTSPAK